MQKTKLFIFSILISTLLFSCGKDYAEVSKSEFINKVLPKVDIVKVEIKNNEKLLIYTSENKSYVIKDFSPNSMDGFLNEIKSKNKNMHVSYINVSNSISNQLIMFQLFTLIIPFLILAHIILLWVSLRKIIKSEIDNIEKIVYTIISIFFPFFGSIIYLTTKKH